MLFESSDNSNNIKPIFKKKSFSLNKVVKEFSITTHKIVLCMETLQRVFLHIEKLLGRVIGEFEIHQIKKEP